MSPETYARVDQVHRQDMLAQATRAGLVAGATHPRTGRPGRWPATALLPYARHALAALAAVAFGLSGN